MAPRIAARTGCLPPVNVSPDRVIRTMAGLRPFRPAGFRVEAAMLGDKRIIHADFLAAEIDAHYHPEAELIGDLAHALWMLNERIDQVGLPAYDLTGQRACREAMRKDFAEHKDDKTEGTIRPQKAVWDARRVMGPHDILLSDVGAHKMWIARHYHCHEPNTCLIPNGFCSMGFALPGAIAAHIVHPEQRILAIAGDA